MATATCTQCGASRRWSACRGARVADLVCLGCGAPMRGRSVPKAPARVCSRPACGWWKFMGIGATPAEVCGACAGPVVEVKAIPRAVKIACEVCGLRQPSTSAAHIVRAQREVWVERRKGIALPGPARPVAPVPAREGTDVSSLGELVKVPAGTAVCALHPVWLENAGGVPAHEEDLLNSAYGEDEVWRRCPLCAGSPRRHDLAVLAYAARGENEAGVLVDLPPATRVCFHHRLVPARGKVDMTLARRAQYAARAWFVLPPEAAAREGAPPTP